MAGGMVYQLERSPVGCVDMVMEANAYDTPFLMNVASYVESKVERHREEWRDWVESNMASKCFSCDKNASGDIISITFHTGYREWYFREQYVRFATALAELQAISTMDGFINNRCYLPLFSLGQLHTNEYANYVFQNDEFIPFDDFVRYVEHDVPYYTGGMLFYHT